MKPVVKPGDGPAKPRRPGGEQFSDPLAWGAEQARRNTPEQRYSPRDHKADALERDINRKIIEEYGRGPLDWAKPLIGIMIIGAVVFSQMDRRHLANAIIYTVMAMMASGAIYTIFMRDTMPPLLSMIFKGVLWLGVIGALVIYAATHVAPDDDKPARESYRKIRDEAVDR